MQTTLIGHPAPPFELDAVSYDNREIRRIGSSSYAGKWLLLLFYPRDFSFVCPTELTAFSANIQEFHARECELLGISVDSVEDHLQWLDMPIAIGGVGPLQFPLASDPGGNLSREYGVWLEKLQCSARGLFLIDPQGILQYSVVHNASVGRSTDETLRVLDALKSGGLCPASWTSADGTIDVESQLQPGRMLGNFRIAQKLGSGAFGSVFAADDLFLQRQVAIKVIGRNASSARDAVLAEARAAARLQHKNICTVYSVEFVDSVPVIVMELVDGRPLSKCDPLSFEPTIRREIALGIAEGLHAAHHQGIVHGDLKPANVIVSADGEAKLLDFGLSRQREQRDHLVDKEHSYHVRELELQETVIGEIFEDYGSQSSLSLTGTPAYMSPELTLGAPATFQSDTFAFGVVLVQLLTGRLPVKFTSLAQALDAIRSGKVRRTAVDMVPASFRKIIDSMLADRPEDRPSIADVIDTLRLQSFGARD